MLICICFRITTKYLVFATKRQILRYSRPDNYRDETVIYLCKLLNFIPISIGTKALSLPFSYQRLKNKGFSFRHYLTTFIFVPLILSFSFFCCMFTAECLFNELKGCSMKAKFLFLFLSVLFLFSSCESTPEVQIEQKTT